MSNERLYSTRELSQLWNVSETTVKRWTHTKGLSCITTPGGHRRFSLSDIIRFQGTRGFQASGLLQGIDSGFSEPEIWINAKNFSEIRKFIFLLALHNRIEDLLEFFNRLYIRGITLAEFYDEILVKLEGKGSSDDSDINLKGYRLNMVRSNLRVALIFFFLGLEPGRPNGKTALCVSPIHDAGVPLQIMECIFREEGWDCLALREPCNLRMMRECVKNEPVNILAIWLPVDYRVDPEMEQREKLIKFLERYRMPVIVIQRQTHSRILKEYYSERSVRSFNQFQAIIKSL